MRTVNLEQQTQQNTQRHQHVHHFEYAASTAPTFCLETLYSGNPTTERGRPTHFSVDEKTKSKLTYGVGYNVVLRDLKVIDFTIFF